MQASSPCPRSPAPPPSSSRRRVAPPRPTSKREARAAAHNSRDAGGRGPRSRAWRSSRTPTSSRRRRRSARSPSCTRAVASPPARARPADARGPEGGVAAAVFAPKDAGREWRGARRRSSLDARAVARSACRDVRFLSGLLNRADAKRRAQRWRRTACKRGGTLPKAAQPRQSPCGGRDVGPGASSSVLRGRGRRPFVVNSATISASGAHSGVSFAASADPRRTQLEIVALPRLRHETARFHSGHSSAVNGLRTQFAASFCHARRVVNLVPPTGRARTCAASADCPVPREAASAGAVARRIWPLPAWFFDADSARIPLQGHVLATRRARW